MKHYRLIFVLLINLIALNFGYAQEKISVAQKGKQIVSMMKEYHLLKPTMDLTLATKIHLSFIDNLDSDSLLFNLSIRQEVNEFASLLQADLVKGSQKYFDTISLIYLENVKNAEKLAMGIFDQKIPQEKSLISDQSDNNKALLSKKWKNTIIESVQNNVIEKLRLKKFEYASDSIPSYWNISVQEVKERYKEYFMDLRNDKSYLEVVFLNTIAFTFDPHSNYFDAEMNQEFSEELTSEREVYGISYQKNRTGNIEIIKTLPGSPAWLSGEIHPGDVIHSLKFGEGETHLTSGYSLSEFEKLFRGNESKTLTITLKDQEENIKSVEITKGKVYSDGDIIKSALLVGESKVGYISLPDFYMNWTDTSDLGCANDLAKALIKLKKENITGLILDLRNNGGGSLKEAIDLAGIFIDFGPILVKNDSENNLLTLKDFNRGAIYTGPLTIMINENSASASEVVAAAIQDYNRGLIVGQKSFGKATGQSVLPVDPVATSFLSGVTPENSEWGYLKMTNIGLYRINLTTNQNRGVLPDITLFPSDTIQNFYETSYNNSIVLPNVEKKMYYTAQKPLPIDVLKAKSYTRQKNDESRSKINDFIELYYQNKKLLEKDTISLSKKIAVHHNNFDIKVQVIELYESESKTYTANSIAYDNAIYELSPYMKTYNEAFLKEISHDIEIEETFNIIQDYIQLGNN